MVLEDQANAYRRGPVGCSSQHLRHVPALQLDQLRLRGEVCPIEPRGQPKRRALEDHRPLEPRGDTPHPDRGLVPPTGRTDEIALGEQSQAQALGPGPQLAEFEHGAFAHVMQVQGDDRRPERTGVLQDLFDRDRGRFETHVPTQRVDAQGDGHGRLRAARGSAAAGAASQSENR